MGEQKWGSPGWYGYYTYAPGEDMCGPFDTPDEARRYDPSMMGDSENEDYISVVYLADVDLKAQLSSLREALAPIAAMDCQTGLRNCPGCVICLVRAAFNTSVEQERRLGTTKDSEPFELPSHGTGGGDYASKPPEHPEDRTKPPGGYVIYETYTTITGKLAWGVMVEDCYPQLERDLAIELAWAHRDEVRREVLAEDSGEAEVEAREAEALIRIVANNDVIYGDTQEAKDWLRRRAARLAGEPVFCTRCKHVHTGGC